MQHISNPVNDMQHRISRTMRILSALLLSALFGLLPAQISAQNRAELPGVEILRSDAAGLDLLVRPVISWDRTGAGDLLPTVAGGLFSPEATSGGPIEPTLVLPVGLPLPEGTRMEVLRIEYGEGRTGRIAPTPTQKIDREGIVTEEYVVDPELYRTYRPADVLATFEYGGVARGLHVGQITVRPLRYDPASNRTEVVRELRIRLRFPSAPEGRRGAGEASDNASVRIGLLNGEQAISWGTPRSLRPLAARPSSIANARAWFRVEVTGSGLHAITAADFEEAGISPSSITNVAVYGGAGTPLPEDVGGALENRMNRLPTIVERSGNRLSRVLFYGTGTTGWELREFDVSDSIPRRLTNPYVRANSYIVAVDGDPAGTFESVASPGAASVYPSYGIARLLHEEDLTNAIAQGNSGNGGGRDWFGTPFVVDDFRPEEKRVFSQELVGLDRSYPVTYRVRVAHNAEGRSVTGRFSFEQNGTAVGDEVTLWSFTDDQLAAVADETVFTIPASMIPADNRSLLGISYSFPGSATGYLDFYEVHYGRKLSARNNTITFESPTGVGVAEYRVDGFGTNQLIGLDVTDPAAPKRLTPVSNDGGTYVFRGPLSSDPAERRRYYIGPLTSPMAVKVAGTAPYAGLRNDDRAADILVITHESLRAGAEAYATYRNQQGRYRATVVSTAEIYTEFSAGRLDPTAIRDYVAHAYHTWSRRPRYLLLVGDGNYDFRKIASDQTEYVPIYTTGERDSYNDLAISVYDDYFVRVDGEDFYIDLAPGRIPATKLEEVETVVAKIRQYESPTSYGPWRERILLVADDNAPVGEGGGFLPQSETLEKRYMPHWMEAEKIYLQEYPSVQGIRTMKPGVTQDLIQWINRGVLLVNWVGHGNARVWGHEHVLEKDEFIPKLTNDTMLTMVMAVTCNFGRFDNPKEVSGGEMFLTHRGGGASVVLATTRAVYINDNAALMEAYFRSIFLRDSVTNEFLPIGDALMATKIRAGARRDNDQKYLIFGDPVMQLNIPTDSVAITTVNTVDVTVDTARISALSEVTVTGSIHDRRGNLREDFNGSAIITLYDADRTKSVPREDSENLTYEMEEKGGQLFRGPAIVTGGRFTATFRVPKDIAYDSTRTGRIYAYAWEKGRDGVGSTCNVVIYGSDTAASIETDGPAITIFVDDRTFRSGDIVTPTPMLIVDLEDESGINASGAGIGHRIEAWVGESPNPIDLTEFYSTSPTDYRLGTAEREILDLEPGEYRVRVRAWDIFNNPSESTAWFRIVEGEPDDLVVTDVLNYPNPMGKETEFLFRHNQSAPLDVTIDIFTAAGRKIRRLDARGVTDRFVRVPWDGRDADGRRVANGVYFYRLRVLLGEGEEQQIVEVIEKVAVAQ